MWLIVSLTHSFAKKRSIQQLAVLVALLIVLLAPRERRCNISSILAETKLEHNNTNSIVEQRTVLQYLLQNGNCKLTAMVAL